MINAVQHFKTNGENTKVRKSSWKLITNKKQLLNQMLTSFQMWFLGKKKILILFKKNLWWTKTGFKQQSEFFFLQSTF